MPPILSIISVIKTPAGGFEQTRASVAQEFGGDATVEYIIKEWSADRRVEETSELPARDAGLRVRCLRGADNGVFDGMNQALERARGEWILFLNAGDWLAPGMGLALHGAMQNNPDADYLFFDGVTVDAGDRKEFLRTAPAEIKMKDFWHRAPVLHPCLVVKREALTIGFYTSLDLAADFELMIRLVAEGRRGEHIPKVAAFILSGGLSERHRLRARWQATRSLLVHSPNALFSLCALGSHLRFILIHLLITKIIRPVPVFRRYAHSRSGGNPAGTYSGGYDERKTTA